MRSITPPGIIVGAAGTLALAVGVSPAAHAGTPVDRPSEFTSAFTAMATPDNVINADGEPSEGEAGARGTFTFMINSDQEIICYDIELNGITPPYESPAKTATHIHQAAAGEAGPPRLAFPDPDGSGDRLTSSGCMQGPFTTGIEDEDGNDTADGFSLAQIEDDPAAFFADTHTEQFPAGAIRGQLRAMPVGGVAAGEGGTANGMTTSEAGLAPGVLAGGAAALIAMTGLGLAWTRRTRGEPTG